MIRIIFGLPGRGKTSLNTYFLREEYRTQGAVLLRKSREAIAKANEERLHPLPFPSAPPIFSDFKVQILNGFRKYYTPFYINGFYFGLDNPNMPTQHVLPGSCIHFQEAQRYFDSRKSKSFPRWVAEAFETHRHYDLTITMDVQREQLIDLNIRAIASQFIEVLGMEHTRSKTGRILQSEFRCREFENYMAVEKYFETGVPEGAEETGYTYYGNVFDAFDSRAQFKNFLPPDKLNAAFQTLPFKNELEKIPPELAMYYTEGEPPEYRGKEK